MTSSLFIGPNLVIDYFTLPNVTPIQAPPELWWSSRERKAVDDVDGLGTSEYLELDFGRLRSLNFLSFDIIQKPITITLEYDVWAFDTGIKMWQAVTPLQNERFDDFVSYSPDSTNPWQNSQFYFTNVKGDLISARYVRLRFERRDEPWPNGDVQNTFPWSIDVKNLRTARYVTNINDARGVLVAQGKVANPIVDPVHYDDGILITEEDIPTLVSVISAVEFEGGGIDAATVTLVGVPSGADVGPSTDAATVTLVGVPSSSDIAPHVDAATVTLTGVPSGSDIAAHVDAGTVTLVGVPSGVDEYTSGTPPDDFGLSNEVYVGYISLLSALAPTGQTSGGGVTMTQVDTADTGALTPLRAFTWIDDTPGHDITDLPYVEEQFGGSAPSSWGALITFASDTGTPHVGELDEATYINTYVGAATGSNFVAADTTGDTGDFAFVIVSWTDDQDPSSITAVTGSPGLFLSPVIDDDNVRHAIYANSGGLSSSTQVDFDVGTANATITVVSFLGDPGWSGIRTVGTLHTGQTSDSGTGSRITSPNHLENE